MSERSREDMILETFASLADTLVDTYDVVELLQTLVDACADLVDVTAAAILLVDSHGQLDVVASTSEASRLVEVMQLSAEAGPCIECFTTGRPVTVLDIAAVSDDWTAFRTEALAQGFQSVSALPLQLRSTVIGALNLMRDSTGELEAHDLRAAQAFADVATIGILQQRAVHDAVILSDQLTHALSSRVVIEQAKGVISHQLDVSTDDAFSVIRKYARSHQRLLSEVAQDIVERRLRLG